MNGGRICLPRYGTARTPERKTHGKRVAVIAEALGTPLMPWQRLVADVAGEVNSDTGRLAYREVRITVPRQSGKTTLILAELVYRCLGAFGPRQRVVYTAQTRKDARAKWESEHVDMLNRSILGPTGDLYRVHLANGAEKITWANGSIHSIDAVTDKSGHGPTLDVGVIDEAWSQYDAAVEQAMKPAMITRPSPQLFIPSTAGNMKSLYLRGKVDDGRARVQSGLNTGVCYFEWSAPDGADPDDPQVWLNCMPALGNTIDMDAIASDRDSMRGNPGEFDRAYLNLWPEARAIIQVIPAESWQACEDISAQFDGRLIWAIDTAPEGAWSSIGAAGIATQGGELVEVIDYRPGPSSWLVERLTELARKHGNWTVAVDGAGPAAAHVPDLELAGFTVIKLSGPQISQACVGFYNAAVSIDDGGQSDRLIHRGQTELNVALASADKMKTGDTWRFVRSTTADISPLYAVTIARWALTTTGKQWRNVLDSIA